MNGSIVPERIYLFRGGELLAPRGEGEDAAAAFFDATALPAIEALKPEARRVYPGGGSVCLACSLAPDPAQPRRPTSPPAPPEPCALPGLPPLVSMPFRAALALLPLEELRAAAKGLALLNWLATARRCGACGAELVDDPKEGYESGARRCPRCAQLHYPRVSPAVIVLVTRGEEALMAHNSAFPPGRFGLIAGFVAPGESLEEAACREIREETGIEVRDLCYRASQPWPFPDSLMVGFTAAWATGEGRPDGVEIDELRWCTRDALPALPPPGSIARFLIDEFFLKGEGTR